MVEGYLKRLFKFLPPGAKKLFKCPSLKYSKGLSSRTKFWPQSITFHVLQAKMYKCTSSKTIWSPFWVSYSLKKVKFCPWKTRKTQKIGKTHTPIPLDQNNKVQLNAPLPGHGTWSNAVGWGGDAECSLAHFSYIGLLSSSVLGKNQELWNK